MIAYIITIIVFIDLLSTAGGLARVVVSIPFNMMQSQKLLCHVSGQNNSTLSKG